MGEAVTRNGRPFRHCRLVDDRCSFRSMPARLGMSRETDARTPARLVAERRLAEDEAVEIAVDLVTAIPTTAFEL